MFEVLFNLSSTIDVHQLKVVNDVHQLKVVNDVHQLKVANDVHHLKVVVGAEPPQMEGVATSGVALQEPGSVQEPCASTSSGVQRL